MPPCPRAAASASTAGMGHHEHHEQPVRAPTPTDPPRSPPLVASAPARHRAEDESLTRPAAPPFHLRRTRHAQATRSFPGRRLRLFEHGKCQEN